MKHTELHQAVQSAAGLRLRLRLQPLYGQGEIIFPCTVAGGKYQTFNTTDTKTDGATLAPPY